MYVIYEQVEEVDEKLMMKLAYMCRGDCSPIQAVIGSITAQEIMKVKLWKYIKLYDMI